MKIKIPKKILMALDYLIIFDPISLIFVLLITLAGYGSQQMVVAGNPPWWVTAFNIQNLLFFTAIFLISGSIFILNQNNHYYQKSRKNKLSPIEKGDVDGKIAKKIAVIAMIVGLAIMLLFQKLFLVGVALIIVILRGFLHNLLNINKKDKGGLWIFSNLIFASLLFLFGWLIKGAISPEIVVYYLPYLAQSVSFLILVFLLDSNMLYKSYKNGEEIIHMGDRKFLIWLAGLMAVIAFALGLRNNDPLISHSMLLALVLYIILIFKVNHLWIVRTISYSALFFVFFISSQFPWFFLFAVIAYYLAKKYYHDRFDLIFPNFGNIEELEENDVNN